MLDKSNVPFVLVMAILSKVIAMYVVLVVRKKPILCRGIRARRESLGVRARSAWSSSTGIDRTPDMAEGRLAAEQDLHPSSARGKTATDPARVSKHSCGAETGPQTR